MLTARDFRSYTDQVISFGSPSQAHLLGGVAQSVEQGTHKPCVTGSIPVAAT